jgi:hypothetical protein
VFDQWLASGSLLSSGGIPSTSFVGALAPFSWPSRGLGGGPGRANPVWSRKGFVLAPSGPFFFPLCFISSPTLVFLFSGASCRWRDFPCGIRELLARWISGRKVYFQVGKKKFFFFKGKYLQNCMYGYERI